MHAAKPIMRFALDVNILMATLEHTGPISDIRHLADVVPTGPARTQIAIVKGIASAIVSGTSEYQLHLTEHVMQTLQYKLGEWAGRRDGWTVETVHTTMETLYSGVAQMVNLGWSADTCGDHTRPALETVVPTEMRRKPWDIDNEDRMVLSDLVAVAALEEWDTTTPTVTMLVTNDGGLQAANEYVQKHYTSFAGEALEASVMIVLPKTVAGLFGRRSR